MFNILEKQWPLISLVLFIVLLAFLCLWPEVQGSLSITIIVLLVGTLITPTVYRRLEEDRKGFAEQSALVRIIILDILGIPLGLASAMVVGSLVSKMVGAAAFTSLRASTLKQAEGVSNISSLLAALTAGIQAWSGDDSRSTSGS